jgi:hypothetical protein
VQLTFEGGSAMYLLTKLALVGKINEVSTTANMQLLMLRTEGID